MIAKKELSRSMNAMLAKANACSLPGDGLRIKGAGAHNTARWLEYAGLVRVARAPDAKARVHVTTEGRAFARRMLNALRELLQEYGFQDDVAEQLQKDGWLHGPLRHALVDGPEAHNLHLTWIKRPLS